MRISGTPVSSEGHPCGSPPEEPASVGTRSCRFARPTGRAVFFRVCSERTEAWPGRFIDPCGNSLGALPYSLPKRTTERTGMPPAQSPVPSRTADTTDDTNVRTPSLAHETEHHELNALAMRAKAGAAEAMNSLFSRTRPDVARFIATRVHPSWVEDLTQETFTRATTGLSHYTGRAPVRMWLFSVARHTVADRYRSLRRQPQSQPVDWWSHSRDLAVPGDFDEYLALLSLVEQLPEDRRTAFTLTQIARVPYAEAAEILGAPIGTIRSRVARGRRDLTRMLRETG